MDGGSVYAALWLPDTNSVPPSRSCTGLSSHTQRVSPEYALPGMARYSCELPGSRHTPLPLCGENLPCPHPAVEQEAGLEAEPVVIVPVEAVVGQELVAESDHHRVIEQLLEWARDRGTADAPAATRADP